MIYLLTRPLFMSMNRYIKVKIGEPPIFFLWFIFPLLHFYKMFNFSHFVHTVFRKVVTSMKWVFIILLMIFLLLLLLLYSKLKIHIHYYHAQDNDELIIQFKGFFGLFRYKINVPIIKFDEDSPSIITKKKVEKPAKGNNENVEKEQYTLQDFIHTIQDMKKLTHHIVDLYSKIIREFFKKITITKLHWESTIGVGDAAYTGIAVGALWAAKGSLIGIITHYFHVPEVPKISINPHFQKVITQTSFTCMIQFRVGHAIFAGIKVFKHWRGGVPKFHSKTLSKLNQIKEKSS